MTGVGGVWLLLGGMGMARFGFGARVGVWTWLGIDNGRDGMGWDWIRGSGITTSGGITLLSMA